ncbi:MAG: hypothetical protein WCK93_08505 [Nitrosomonadales bacterium]
MNNDAKHALISMSGATSQQEEKELANELARAAIRQETRQSVPAPANGSEAERRNREIEPSGWLAANVNALLAFAIILLTFWMYWYIVFSGDEKGSILAQRPEMKDIIIYILGALTTVATQVISYYFGSSSGSADKSRALSTIAKRR